MSVLPSLEAEPFKPVPDDLWSLFGAHDVNKNLLLDREEVRGMLNKLFCLEGTAGIAEEELDHMMVRPSPVRVA